MKALTLELDAAAGLSALFLAAVVLSLALVVLSSRVFLLLLSLSESTDSLLGCVQQRKTQIKDEPLFVFAAVKSHFGQQPSCSGC